MGQFANDLNKFTKKTETVASEVCRKIALDTFRRIVQRSPVDTGRFRANNQISLNELPVNSVLEFDKRGAATIRIGDQTVQRFKLGDTIFIYNNVAYALPLEYGRSKQAPQGVYRISFQDMIAHLKKIAREAVK